MKYTLLEYIKEFKNNTFEDVALNEIDALIFSNLSYNKFPAYIKQGEKKLSQLKEDVLKINEFGYGISRDNGLKIITEIFDSVRYKNVRISNYKYELGANYQFGMILIKISDDLMYVSYEGTDATREGWREDFEISYNCLIKSVKLANYYLNQIMKKYPKAKFILTGHSKGGFLAINAAMSACEKERIDAIFAFDAPGIDDENYKKDEYNDIKDKIKNIMPEQTFFGTIYNHDNTLIIKSNEFGLMQHSPISWFIENDTFVTGKISNFSITLQNALENWFKKTTDKEREEITNGIFQIFEELNVKNFMKLDYGMIEYIYNIIKTSTHISKETRAVMLSSFNLLLGEFGSNLYKTIKKRIIQYFKKP